MAKRSRKTKRSLGAAWNFPWKPLFQAALIIAATWWIYGPALNGGWLWDDDFYVTNNLLMHDPYRLWKAWFQPGSFVEYYPLQESVQWLQWQLWGKDTLGYHLTNVVLHLASALLVWRLLDKFHLKLAWLGGLLFAIHPVQVESVAWISELKNTLSLPPFLLATCAWIDYEEHRRSRDYWLALGLFLVAMLCKISMAPFPLVILLYAWWRRNRIGWEDLKACAPFLAISLALGLMTILAGDWYRQSHRQHEDIVVIGDAFSRLALAGQSLWFFFSKCFWPVGLSLTYPQWIINPPSLDQFLPWPILGGFMAWFWTQRRSWGRHVLLGLGFFLLTLAPFLGFVAATYMAFTWVMDHFLYLPIIGLIGLAVAGMGQLEERLSAPLRICGRGAVAVGMALLSWGSHAYAAFYLNSESLWTYTLTQNPQAWMAHNNLGKALIEEGRAPEALAHYEQALKIQPDLAEAHYNLGYALMQTGHVTEAMERFEQALKINPSYAEAHTNLGMALMQSGRTTDAIAQFAQALEINPDLAEAHNDLGMALMDSGHAAEAMAQFDQALTIRPDYAEALNNSGMALMQSGRVAEAISHYEQAVTIKPDYAEVHYNLGNALTQSGRAAEAIAQFDQALKIKPNYPEAHTNWGAALMQSSRTEEAISHYEQALKINPDLAEAHINLGAALAQSGRTAEAIAHYEQALKINPNFAGVHYNLGNALMRTGHVPEAIAHYEQALKINPDLAEAHNNLGLALMQTGHTTEAGAQFGLALKLNPNYAEARENLKRLQSSQKVPEKR